MLFSVFVGASERALGYFNLLQTTSILVLIVDLVLIYDIFIR